MILYHGSNTEIMEIDLKNKKAEALKIERFCLIISGGGHGTRTLGIA